MFSKKNSVYVLVLSFAVVLLGASFSRISAASVSIVNPNQVYTYAQMTKDIKQLADAYPNLIQYESIGKTAYGRDIWAIRLGNGEATIFINGSHHAREWLTTNLNMYMIDQYVQAYSSNQNIGKYPVRQMLKETTLWFVPMVNPDGVTLQQFGVSTFPKSVQSTLIKFNRGSTNFDRWKANAKGVDLNRQYPANWEHLKNAVSYPNYMDYKGTAPIQAEETKAIVTFTKRINPEIAVSYHAAGRILFWNYHTPKVNLSRDQSLANQFSAITGYAQVKPTPNPSGGGYTDWFIKTYGRPAFTPELGIKRGETNLPVSAFASEWKKNKTIGLWIADEGYKLWYAKNKNKVSIQNFAVPFMILEETPLYNQNNFLSPSSLALSPQIIQSIRRAGMWLSVNTSAGEKWIYDPNPQIGELESIDLYLDIQQDFPVYESPLDNKPMSTFKKQEVHAIQKWETLYQIETGLGPKWINLTQIPVNELKAIEQSVTLSQSFTLYDEPEGVATQEITEVPQEVIAFREWNGWYKIQLNNQQSGWIQINP